MTISIRLPQRSEGFIFYYPYKRGKILKIGSAKFTKDINISESEKPDKSLRKEGK